MNLTNNFTLEELTVSQEAIRKGLDNTPGKGILSNLINTAENMELVRNVLNGHPIIVTSGYRSPEVNAAVGGSKTSQHTKGQAVDFTCPKYGTPREIVRAIKNAGIKYDQLILEFDRWVHISFSDNNRDQVFVIDRNGVSAFS
jgi:hypothetical protein